MRYINLKTFCVILALYFSNSVHAADIEQGGTAAQYVESEESSLSGEDHSVVNTIQQLAVEQKSPSMWQSFKKTVCSKTFIKKSLCFGSVAVFEAAGILMVIYASRSGEMHWETPACPNWSCQGQRTQFGFGLVGIIAGPSLAAYGFFV